jgi:acetyl-CoA C-acetyltransferase
VAGGVENMSAVPHVLPGARFGTRLGPPQIVDPLVVTCPYTGVPRAVQAGVEALEFGVERAEQDDWAARSHALYWEAADRGGVRAGSAVVDVEDRDGRRCLLEQDECPRREVDVEALAALPSVYGSPTVTAGNAPNLATGATAVVVMRRELARDLGRRAALARVVASVQTAGEPSRIASVPARAAARALELAGLTLADLHVIEINEAFAAVPLVTTQVLADRDRYRTTTLRERTNRWGGAIALGHPTGATGARLLMSAIAQLEERGGGLGLVTICGGVGEAEAMIVEVAEA